MTITINILDAGIIKNPDTGADFSQYAVFSIYNDADAPPGPFLYGRGGIDTSETDIQGLLDTGLPLRNAGQIETAIKNKLKAM